MPTRPTRLSRRSLLLPAAALIALLATLTLTPTPTSAQDPASFRQTWRAEFEASARKVVSLAEAMPAETYSWQPMEGVATVAAAYMHIARYNYQLPHRNMGVDPPEGVDYATFEEAFTTKGEVLEVLRASMDHVRAVVDGMSDEDMAATGEPVRSRRGQMGRALPAPRAHERAPGPADRLRAVEPRGAALVGVTTSEPAASPGTARTSRTRRRDEPVAVPAAHRPAPPAHPPRRSTPPRHRPAPRWRHPSA